MGSSFIPPDEDNLTGYWEDQDFVWINKGILENAGGSWDKPPKPKDIHASYDKFNKAFIKTITKKELNVGSKLWGFKDPRTCITAEVFHQWLPNPKYIVIKRDEEDVVRSLSKRDPTVEVSFWRNLCKEYNNRIERFKGKNSPKLMTVSYESIVDPFSSGITLSNIARFIGIERKALLVHQKFVKFAN